MKIFRNSMVAVLLFIGSVGLFACDQNTDLDVEDKVGENLEESYTITWKDADGTVLDTEELDSGTTPNRELPNDTEQWTYESWSPSISEVTKDMTYTATRSATMYDITWLDVDGTELDISAFGYGERPSHALPEDTVEWNYTGWAPEITDVTGDTSYQAVREKQTYAVTFDTDGGTNIDAQTLTYGSQLNQPNDPEKDGYNFVGWSIQGTSTNILWPLTIHEDVVIEANWNEVVPYGTYLSTLLDNYFFDPYSFIPEAMQPGYHLVDASYATTDYSSFVSDIPSPGFGEQWYMVINNIEESQSFFEVLTVVDTLSATSIAAFNNYLDSNPEDTSSFEFMDGIYNVTIRFEDELMYYVLDYTANVPVFGEQTVQIALEYDILTGEKVGRIQIGDANALRYVTGDGYYEFAIKYLGVRRAYIEMEKDEEDEVEGRIFEYIGIDGSYNIGSSAQFYINNEYASVVGNKSNSMMGWEGVITELYDVDEGQLLGYEVKETLSNITYNTMWFNLTDTTGISSIKIEDAPIEESNPHYVYINGSSDVFNTKAYGGLNTKTLSRRFDIEMRKQYLYYLNGDDIVGFEVEVPMIFIQVEKLDDFESDVLVENTSVLSTFSLDVNSDIIDKIDDDYLTLIDIFIVQKDEMTPEAIIEIIGDAYDHE